MINCIMAVLHDMLGSLQACLVSKLMLSNLLLRVLVSVKSRLT